MATITGNGDCTTNTAKEFPNDVTYGDWQERLSQGLELLPTTARQRQRHYLVDRVRSSGCVARQSHVARLAIAGKYSARNIQVTVNGVSAGTTGPMRDTGVLRRDGIRGYWFERDIGFDATKLKAGPNVLALSIPAGGVMNGVLYDYLRLELDSSCGCCCAVSGRGN